jgi:hypothetical protein
VLGLTRRDGVTDNFTSQALKSVVYGTPEMASEIMRLFTVSDVRSRQILVMAGHEGGIVAFGKNLDDAFDVLMRARQTSWLKR